MKIIIPILGVVLLTIAVAAYQAIRIKHFAAIGEKLAKETKRFSQHPASPTKRILVLGDSLAVGVGSASPSTSIAGRIGADYPDADITNAAISGARTGDLATQLKTFESESFDLVAIQIGGNDVTHFTSAKKASSEFADTVIKSKMISPDVIVWSSGSVGFAPIFQFPASTVLTLRTRILYKYLKQAATDAGATYIDLYVPWKEDIFKQDIKRYYAPDKFHVTGDAYGVWYEKIKPALKNLI